MIVSDTQRMLFVHVQKTGGSSVTNLISAQVPGARDVRSMQGDKHATLPTILRKRPEWSDYFIFGFVRNPWARMLSWHQMIERRLAGVPARVEKNAFWRGVCERHPDFESFVLRAPDEFGRLRRPQLDYLRHGDRVADFIGRTENLDADLASIRERLGLSPEAEVPHRNAGPPRSYREAYTPEMRARVAELFAVDIEAFGYEF